MDEKTAQEKKKLRIGRVLSGISLGLSAVLGAWFAYLFPITDTLSAQGRMHEGDSDGIWEPQMSFLGS